MWGSVERKNEEVPRLRGWRIVAMPVQVASAAPLCFFAYYPPPPLPFLLRTVPPHALFELHVGPYQPPFVPFRFRFAPLCALFGLRFVPPPASFGLGFAIE